MKYKFNVENSTKGCINWIKAWFEKNGKDCNAVIGMSGGKDSTIVAKLCVEALGADRVIGVAMPDEGQGINEADKICEYLGIRYLNFPINEITYAFDVQASHSLPALDDEGTHMSEQSLQNIPPRVRMTVLYAIAQTYNGRVANTCNFSEDYVGYATLFGDSAGSFAPLSQFTVTEIYAIGDYLGIPRQWVHKTPDDGLPFSSSDEQKFGFSYAELDEFIRNGIEPSGDCDNNPGELKKEKIKRMHNSNKFKTEIIQIPCYQPLLYIIEEKDLEILLEK